MCAHGDCLPSHHEPSPNASPTPDDLIYHLTRKVPVQACQIWKPHPVLRPPNANISARCSLRHPFLDRLQNNANPSFAQANIFQVPGVLFPAASATALDLASLSPTNLSRLRYHLGKRPNPSACAFAHYDTVIGAARKPYTVLPSPPTCDCSRRRRRTRHVPTS